MFPLAFRAPAASAGVLGCVARYWLNTFANKQANKQMANFLHALIERQANEIRSFIMFVTVCLFVCLFFVCLYYAMLKSNSSSVREHRHKETLNACMVVLVAAPKGSEALGCKFRILPQHALATPVKDCTRARTHEHMRATASNCE